MSLGRCEVALLASKQSHTASTLIISNETRMYSCLANEGVATIHSVGNRGILFSRCRAANHEVCVVNFLVAHSMRVEDLCLSAVRGASKRKCSIVKWSTSVAVQAAAVSRLPARIQSRSFCKIKTDTVAYQKLAPHHIDCGFP